MVHLKVTFKFDKGIHVEEHDLRIEDISAFIETAKRQFSVRTEIIVVITFNGGA